MQRIPFLKISGCGNDFIVIDNRKTVVDETDLSGFVRRVCRRKMSVGADGLILIESSGHADFKWRFFNADGSTAGMCGNGARCAARFAFVQGIAGKSMRFETLAGIIQAHIIGDHVKVRLTDPQNLITGARLEIDGDIMQYAGVNTGVPHVVLVADDIDNAPVVSLGRRIRFHDNFAPHGTNVNFIAVADHGTIVARTYERGVEDETSACGTGAVACAVSYAVMKNQPSPIRILTRSGGYLKVSFNRTQCSFSNVCLEGDARIVYGGELWSDAWQT